MNKDQKNQASFIPCGDSLEKMEEIREEELESVSGGAGIRMFVQCTEEVIKMGKMLSEARREKS